MTDASITDVHHNTLANVYWLTNILINYRWTTLTKINKHSLLVCEYRPLLGKRFGNCAAVSVIRTWTLKWFQLVQRTQRPLGNRWRHTSVTHNVTFGANTQNLCHLQRDVLPRTRTDRNNKLFRSKFKRNGRDHQLQPHCADLAAAQRPTTLLNAIFIREFTHSRHCKKTKGCGIVCVWPHVCPGFISQMCHRLNTETEAGTCDRSLLTFSCQLTVVWLLAWDYLLHQLVVAAVAHCLDDVMHLQSKVWCSRWYTAGKPAQSNEQNRLAVSDSRSEHKIHRKQKV